MTRNSNSGTGSAFTMASWLCARIHDVSGALHNHLDMLPVTPPREGVALKEYLVSVGEALACHDEIRILRQLAQEKGFEPESGEKAPASRTALRDGLREALRLVQTPSLQPALRSLGCAELAYIVPDLSITRKSPRATQLRREEEKLKNRYARLLPASQAPQPAAGKTEIVSLPRAVREKNWLDLAKIWEERKDALDQVFTELITTRTFLAADLGFDSYADYLAHRRRGLNWLPERFLRRLVEATSPLLRSLHEHRKAALRLKRLRPFDLNTKHVVGALAFPQWRKKMERLMERIHPDFMDCFTVMCEEGLIDARNSCAGMCLHLQHSRRPYVQVPTGISPKELMAAVHEIGHGVHIFLAAHQEIPFYRRMTPLSGELAALRVELLASPHLEAFFEDSAAASWVRRKHLEGIASVFTTAMGIETFEEEIYSREMSAAARQEAFESIMKHYLGLTDYTGYEKILRTWYHRIPTLVFSPGYFLHYAVAQAGALAVCPDPVDLMRFMRQGTRFSDECLYSTAGASPEAFIDSRFVERLGAELRALYRSAPLS